MRPTPSYSFAPAGRPPISVTVSSDMRRSRCLAACWFLTIMSCCREKATFCWISSKSCLRWKSCRQLVCHCVVIKFHRRAHLLYLGV